MTHDTMISQGVFLFRWRSYTPVLLVSVLAVAMTGFTYPLQNHSLDEVWDFLCFGIALAGLSVRALTVGFVPRKTSGRTTKNPMASQLNTTGSYSILRHPLYFANFWIWMGVALLPHIWWLPLIAGFVYIFVYERIICAEEAFLSGKFGEEYTKWAQNTPVIWPRLSQWQRPSLPFSYKAVLRRETSTFLGIVTVFFLLECAATRVAEGHFELDLPWVVLFALALTQYVVIKTLRKLRLLSEPNR